VEGRNRTQEHIPLLLRLAKRSHGSQRVHVVPPLHNLAVLNSHDRYEPVVVGCAGSDNLTVHLVFEDHDTSILGSMHDERVRAPHKVNSREALMAFYAGYGNTLDRS
jgi:hypothetical protein